MLDFVITLMPCPAIWRLSMSKRREDRGDDGHVGGICVRETLLEMALGMFQLIGRNSNRITVCCALRVVYLLQPLLLTPRFAMISIPKTVPRFG